MTRRTGHPPRPAFMSGRLDGEKQGPRGNVTRNPASEFINPPVSGTSPMRTIRNFAGGVLAAATICLAVAGPAHALTTKECSAKYQAAKKDGSLSGENWKSFRTRECASGSTTAAAPAAGASPAATRPSVAAAAAGTATFPSAIDPKYSKETAGKGRMQTCLDQYKANKASNANGGLHWIQKGGGYYSECSKKLKGA